MNDVKELKKIFDNFSPIQQEKKREWFDFLQSIGEPSHTIMTDDGGELGFWNNVYDNSKESKFSIIGTLILWRPNSHHLWEFRHNYSPKIIDVVYQELRNAQMAKKVEK